MLKVEIKIDEAIKINDDMTVLREILDKYDFIDIEINDEKLKEWLKENAEIAVLGTC